MFSKSNLPTLIRIFSYSILAITFIFLINNILTLWFDWPGVKKLFSNYGLFGFKKLGKPLEGSQLIFSFLQLIFYIISILFSVFYVLRSINQTLKTDAEILTNLQPILFDLPFGQF